MRPILLVCLIAVALSACGTSDGGGGGGDVSIVSAVYPLTFVAQRIAGDAGEVTDLTPGGQEPHDIELSSEQIVSLAGSDLLIYVGADFQPAVEQAVPEAGGDTLDVLEATDVLEVEGAVDPHVWMDPLRLADVTNSVADRLAEIDGSSADRYRDNAADLIADLESLDADMEAGLADCDRRELVTAHDAFGYLADRYGLEQVGIAGIDPEAEPSPQRLAEVTDFVREHDVGTIFFEELLSPDVAETIAAEVGVDTATLNPLESPPEGGDYLSAMKDNLDSLQRGLRCAS